MLFKFRNGDYESEFHNSLFYNKLKRKNNSCFKIAFFAW